MLVLFLAAVGCSPTASPGLSQVPDGVEIAFPVGPDDRTEQRLLPGALIRDEVIELALSRARRNGSTWFRVQMFGHFSSAEIPAG